MRKFVDLAVFPAGKVEFGDAERENVRDRIIEMLRMASILNLSCVCLLFNFSRRSEASSALKLIENCKETVASGVDIRLGAYIRTESEKELKKRVDRVKEKVDIVMVEGRGVAINRAACSNPWVDVLLDPHRDRKDCGMDHVMAKLAADHKVGVGVSFKSILEAAGKKRVHILSYISRNIRLCEKYGCEFAVVSGAESWLEMRDGHALASLTRILGCSPERALAFVSDNPERILDRARERKEYILPGVKIVNKGEWNDKT